MSNLCLSVNGPFLLVASQITSEAPYALNAILGALLGVGLDLDLDVVYASKVVILIIKHGQITIKHGNSMGI